MNRKVSVILPEFVYEIIARIENAGFLAYAVGGCVRDAVLGRIPDDYDISTSASPEDIAGIFSDTVPVGREFGTVGVKAGKGIVEITTFRKDGEYFGHRRPLDVSFSSDLNEDLARRDFTINAMAYNLKSGITDPIDGMQDIKKHLVRAVGDPEKRFEEDALRMLRAFRFAAKLGFEIETETLDAIKKKSLLIEHISAERVNDELIKILGSDNSGYALYAVRFGLLDPFLKRRGKELKAVWRDSVPPGNPALCAFIRLLKENGMILDEKEFLISLKSDRATVNLISRASQIEFKTGERTEIKKIMSSFGERTAKLSAMASENIEVSKMIDEIIESGEPFRLDQLSVDGNDVNDYGITGKDTGEVLAGMLNEVIEDPKKNNKQYLLAKLEKK